MVDTLVNALDDSDPVVRSRVVWALGRIGAESRFQALPATEEAGLRGRAGLSGSGAWRRGWMWEAESRAKE